MNEYLIKYSKVDDTVMNCKIITHSNHSKPLCLCNKLSINNKLYPF